MIRLQTKPLFTDSPNRLLFASLTTTQTYIAYMLLDCLLIRFKPDLLYIRSREWLYISFKNFRGKKKSVTQKQSCVQKYGPCRKLSFFQEDFDNGCVYVCVWKCYCGTYGLGGCFFFSILNETNLASLTFISFAEAVKIILKGQCVFWYLQPTLYWNKTAIILSKATKDSD